MLDYLDRVDTFANSKVTASCVKRQLDWLSEVLYAAERRAVLSGLRPGRLEGVFQAIAKHDALLAIDGAVAAPRVRAARDILRFEISYLASSN
jgi:hypothetical protein